MGKVQLISKIVFSQREQERGMVDKGKRGQIFGDGRKSVGGEHTMQYTHTHTHTHTRHTVEFYA